MPKGRVALGPLTFGIEELKRPCLQPDLLYAVTRPVSDR